MHPIARQSARLANRNGRRQSSLPRKRHPLQQRAFHVSVRQSQDPRGPNVPSDHHTHANGVRDSAKKSEAVAGKSEQGAEQENGASKPATDNRSSGARRSFRSKRFNDVPKPPAIPDWFLRHNVRLVKDSPGLGVSQENEQAIRCVDAETGHTLFSVPYYEAWPKAVESRAKRNDDWVRGKHGDKVLVEEQQAKTDQAPVQEESAAAEGLPTESKSKNGLEQDFFDHKFRMSKARAKQQHPTPKREPTPVEFALPKNALQQLDSKSDPMRWTFLEVETSIRAALSLSSETQRSASFAADRVDVSLQCPDPDSHDQMDEIVRDLARIVQADVIRFDVNDFAELSGDYVGHGHDEPGSFSTLGYDVYDGYAASSLDSQSGFLQSRPQEEENNDEMDEDEEDDEEAEDAYSGGGQSPFTSLEGLRKAMSDGSFRLPNGIRAQVIGLGMRLPQVNQQNGISVRSTGQSGRENGSEMNRDDARLGALLDHLLDAPKQKRSGPQPSEDGSSAERRHERRKQPQTKDASGNLDDKSYQRILRYWRSNAAYWLPQTARSLVLHLIKGAQDVASGKPAFTLSTEEWSTGDIQKSAEEAKSRTIVHVRDLRDLYNSRLGDSIVHRLAKVVQKRRRSGEQIMIVGTTAQDVSGPIRLPGEQADAFPFRSINVPPFFSFSLSDEKEMEAHTFPTPSKSLDEPAYRRILEINLRHVQSMLRKLRPDDNVDLISHQAQRQLDMPGMHFLSERVLSLDQVQRLTLTAIGLAQSHAKADVIKPIHIALGGFVVTRSDHAAHMWSAFRDRKQSKKFRSDLGFGNHQGKDSDKADASARLEQVKKSCNSHETRLLSGVVDPLNIKTGFADVHAPPETIEALKTLTTLSLLRPDAFKYGVLANDRLPGLLLYGPPGTGKTLLAKAVAKESKATVLEISGAQIYEKYVGEGEKMVRAVFSLAKKLTPCVVFIDEADAIFGSRSNAGNRNTHREIINQFLREWDGMDDHGVFMMVASNRPFDLDDAVLRRLPRRLLIDLPVVKDRESILGIHLKHESIDSSVSLGHLAEQTPLYSGSDLKNLAVAAALAAVREENELTQAHSEDKEFKLPEKRTLTSTHFDKALAEISASISEDMSSLTAIRKFDEQYGDRRGRRKKTGYGFGAAHGVVDESAARVRQASSAPPPP